MLILYYFNIVASMAQLSNGDIFEILRTDKSAGIRILFDRYYAQLVAYANKQINDFDSAEDIVQELFVRLWTDNYLLEVSINSLSGYLFASVKNSCYTFLVKNKRLKKVIQTPSIDIPVEIDNSKIYFVIAEIDKLPSRTRDVVMDVMINGMKYKEAAEKFGISVNTVKFLLKTGMRRIRAKIGDNNELITVLGIICGRFMV